MQLFYTFAINGNSCVLSEDESWHCMKVLRLGEGDPVSLTDGAGNFYQGFLTKIHAKGCLVEIKSKQHFPRHSWHLHLAVAPTKNIDRFEWFLEKSVEIGIDEITPLFCEHSERNTVKMERLEKIVVSAMKQSLKAWLPKLNEPKRFKEFIAAKFPGQKFIGYCETGIESALHDAYSAGSDALILVGPEGDFSKNEVELARDSGFIPVSFGKSRLRTETAGIVAVQTIGLMNMIRKQ